MKTKKNYITSVIEISGFEKKMAKINNFISQHSRWTTVQAGGIKKYFLHNESLSHHVWQTKFINCY
jgi:hypothetical protein